MYGSLARMQVRPAGWDALRWLADAGRQPRGRGGLMVLRMDRDPSEAYALAIAESEAAYRALSEIPEMHAAYVGRRRWLESDPEWHDGTIVHLEQYDVPEGAQLYGTIAEMQLKPEALPSLMESRGANGRFEGQVALCVLQTDADPERLFVVALAESEAACRAFSESAASHQQYLEMRAWLAREPVWHDGQVVQYEGTGG